MIDIVALGELLVDFTPHGESERGNIMFERNPGGAPANVLAAASRLGCSTAFIGKVGRDMFGLFLKKVLEEKGINTEGLRFSDKVNTTLAFVQLDEQGDREFSFYRNPGADITLLKEDLNYRLLKQARIFHFGSLSLTDEPSRSATLEALRFAKEKGAFISYDPNLRISLWSSLEKAREQIISAMHYADIMKISEEELEFITGTANVDKGLDLLSEYGISVILVTLGAEGCAYRYAGGSGYVPSFRVTPVDTTGAGDGFLGAVLSRLCSQGIDMVNSLDKAEFENVIRFANAVGAIVTTRKGAISIMPDIYEIQRFLRIQV